MNIIRKNVPRQYLRNGNLSLTGGEGSYTSVNNISYNSSGDFLPAIFNEDGTYTVNLEKVLFKGDIVALGGVSAYGISGESGGESGGNIVVYDGLDSKSVDVALSANQGRILKLLIDNIKVEDIEGYYTKEETNSLITNHTHSIDKIEGLQEALDNKAAIDTHSKDTTVHITATERTNWNTAYNNSHSHSNKTVLDDITTALVTNWNTAYNNNHTHSNKTVLDTIASDDINWVKNIRSKIVLDGDNVKVNTNLFSTGELSAYGSGEGDSGSSGSLKDLVDVSLSNLTTGLYLKFNGSHWVNTNLDIPNLSGYATQDWVTGNNYATKDWVTNLITYGAVDVSGLLSKTEASNTYQTIINANNKIAYSNISGTPTSLPASDVYSWAKAASKPSYKFSEITNKPTTLAGYGITDAAASSHSHSQYLTDLPTHTHSKSEITDFPTSMPASDVYSWAKASSKPSYKWDEITNKPTEFNPASHTHSYASSVKVGTTSYSVNSNVISLPAYPTLTSLDAAPSSHTHSIYYDSTISRTANTVLAAPNGSAGGATFRTLVAADIPTLAISKISGLQTALDGKSSTSHTHNYAGSSSAGGAATSANKVNSTLSWSGYSSGSFNGSSAASISIPSNTNLLINGAGFITASSDITGNAASATNADKLDGYHGSSSNTANTYVLRGSSGLITVGAVTSSGEITAYSDIRLKSDIKPLEIRGELNPVTYKKDGKDCIGFIANEVKEVYPELVIDGEYLSLNYAQLTAVLYAEIKLLKSEIKELNEKIRIMAN